MQHMADCTGLQWSSLSPCFYAFLLEHHRSEEFDAGVEPALVWMAYDCGAELVRPLDEPSKDK